MEQQGYVDYSVDQAVGTIRFFHPAHNALPAYLLEALTAAVERGGADPAAHVLRLESAGDRTFCAGASFDELAAVTDEAAGIKFFSGFAAVINACRRCPKLIIGRVQGKAVGGGVGIAAATDYCFATEAAAIRLSELTLGIGPFVVAPAIERKIGLAALSRLAIRASEWQSAAWAREHGLYTELFADIAGMDAAMATLAAELAASSPAAMRALKQMLWQGTEHWDTLLAERAALSGMLILSAQARAAMAAFKAGKR
ncbi:enoyl-CoA hydratase/isomerase family protein [Compostibacter hankyongensis]|uniref:Enoyl-CoA hydratase/isomerase family protein n=1 Tax=Compostibacter hankyongensis TaxID=1007089 RepID=A0ABP8G362_9BACT